MQLKALPFALALVVLQHATALARPVESSSTRAQSQASSTANNGSDLLDALGQVFVPTSDTSPDTIPMQQQSNAPPSTSVKLVSANFYSAVVAVGASYTDNAHARDKKYADSLRQYYPFDKYGGRYTNGKVGVEWMVDLSTKPALKQSKSGVALIDYAYGGSVVNNGLAGTWAKSPAANDQAKQYLSDVDAGSIKLGQGRVLHYFNSGINPVAQIWSNALEQKMSYSAVYNAKRNVTANVKDMVNTIRAIATNSKLNSQIRGVDTLIVGIPPLETVPTYTYQLPKNLSQVDRKKALAVLGQLASQYNDALAAFAAELKSQTSGRVFFYDMAKLWRSMTTTPSKYGLKQTLDACYNSTTGKVCSNPEEYLYFDTLHPTTKVMKIMAQEMNGLVLGL
ncbi:hypothetical protein OIV83_006220 [Microbotryomycetes sp. JL201]|nr:hypothetical protein OIV83_006220 [Microbotryomycetes sp. JL201]